MSAAARSTPSRHGSPGVSIPGWWLAEQATANVRCSKTFFSVTLCTQTMFSVLVFMCRDPGDATSKVSCCVESSYCFKNRDLDAIVKVPVALPLKMILNRKQKYGKS